MGGQRLPRRMIPKGEIEMGNAVLDVSLVFGALMLVGAPMAYCMVLTAGVYFFVLNPLIPLTVIAQTSIGMIAESFTLLAVPLFLLAGDLLNACGMTERLVSFAVALTSSIRGGVGHAVVVANIIMAGMSGSATADAAGIGAMMIPALQKAKFHPATAAALCASASVIGPIIPPSIPMVIYASLAGVSLGRLMLAGFIPGIIMGLFLMAGLYLSPESASVTRVRFNLRGVLRTGRDAILAIIMPFIILGGMFSGVYTPTEGAAMAVAYALLIGILVYHTLTPRVIFGSLRNTARITGAIMFIVATANVLSWILTAEDFGGIFKSLFTGLRSSPGLTLLTVAAVILFLGCFLESAAILVIMTPFLAPVGLAAGIDPIHFGLVFVFATLVGVITPPVGMSMFVTCSIAGISVPQFSRAVWRPLLALLICLLVLSLWPDLTLFVPNLVMGKP